MGEAALTPPMAAPGDSLSLQEVNAASSKVPILPVASTQFVSGLSVFRSPRRALVPSAALKLGMPAVPMSLSAAKRSIKGTASGEESAKISAAGDLRSNTLLFLHFVEVSKEEPASCTAGICSSKGIRSSKGAMTGPLTLRDRLPRGAAGGFAAAGGTLAEDVSSCMTPAPSVQSRRLRLAAFLGSRRDVFAAGPAASAEAERTTFLLRLRHSKRIRLILSRLYALMYWLYKLGLRHLLAGVGVRGC